MTRFVQPMKGKLSPSINHPMKDIEAELQKALAPEIRRHVVELKASEEGLIVSLREIGFYVSGSATLRPFSKDAIDRLAAVLKSRAESMRIEGHTDNVPHPQWTFCVELGAFDGARFRSDQGLRRALCLRASASFCCGLRRISSRRFQHHR